MQESIFNNLNLGNSGRHVELKVEHISDNLSSVKMIIVVQGNEYWIEYAFNEIKDQLTISNLEAAGKAIKCISLCGLALSGPIYDCYRKNKKNKKNFTQCLKDQKVTLETTLAACLLGCF